MWINVQPNTAIHSHAMYSLHCTTMRKLVMHSYDIQWQALQHTTMHCNSIALWCNTLHYHVLWNCTDMHCNMHWIVNCLHSYSAWLALSFFYSHEMHCNACRCSVELTHSAELYWHALQCITISWGMHKYVDAIKKVLLTVLEAFMMHHAEFITWSFRHLQQLPIVPCLFLFELWNQHS